MSAGPTLAELAALVARVGALDPQECGDHERIELIRVLEELKSAASAAQADHVAAFADSQRAANLAAGVAPARAEKGVPSQVALAMRISPVRAQRHVVWARLLASDLPSTRAALRRGVISEWRAMLVARETAWLSAADRRAVDAEIGPRLAALGDRQVEAETRKLAYRHDPGAAVARARAAENDRRVTVRPAPDTMCWLSTLLPVAQGVAAYAALSRHADARVGVGEEPRGRGQLMADALVERVTGQARADAVPVEIELVMTETALLAPPGTPGRDEPAVVIGHGPVPAGWARSLVGAARHDTPVWLRRLFTQPETGQLAQLESRRRRFSPAQRRFVRLRDGTCRTPWCGAPVRHTDHVVPAARGGPTSVANAAGLCESCNYAKQAPGWRALRTPEGSLAVTTPTGHRYTGHPPDPPGASPPARSRVESVLRRLLDEAA